MRRETPEAWTIVAQTGAGEAAPKSVLYQTKRTELRRRQDKLLFAVAGVAAELLDTSNAANAISRALNLIQGVVGIRQVWISQTVPDCEAPTELVPLRLGHAVSVSGRFTSPPMRAFLEKMGVSAAVIIPITIDRDLWGHIGFEGCQADDGWTEDDIHLLQVATDLIGAHIAREQFIAQLVEARDDAMRSRAEAEAANTAKSDFLASMSHELRTPLNAIIGFSDMMQRESFGPMGSPHYKEYAQDVHKSGSHLLSLINDLLDISKIESGRMELDLENVHVADTVEDAAQFIKARTRERGQSLDIAIESRSICIEADERALKQIIINLLSNASKYAPQGGAISVTVGRDVNGDCRFTVRDNGPGIEKEKLGGLFNRFVQTDNHYDREHEGSGLGLNLVRRLAELHGGRAWIESEPGRGTEAIVTFPMQHPFSHLPLPEIRSSNERR